MKLCSVSECNKPVRARGYCAAHYARFKKYGDPLANFVRPTPEQRFKLRINRDHDCWEWIGTHTRDGYAIFAIGTNKTMLAHRFAYEMANGPIPEGLVIDHLCRNRGCVNPDHLEAVTFAENIRRGVTGATTTARQLAKTHCPRGHEYSDENTYRYTNAKGSSYRMCKECCRLRSQGLTNGWADHKVK